MRGEGEKIMTGKGQGWGEGGGEDAHTTPAHTRLEGKKKIRRIGEGATTHEATCVGQSNAHTERERERRHIGLVVIRGAM